MDAFQKMMGNLEARRPNKFETKPWLCGGCGKRFETHDAYLGHLGAKIRDNSLTHYDIPKNIEPSARKGKKLPPGLATVGEDYADDIVDVSEKIDPQVQRQIAAKKPKHTQKDIPEGWSKEKILQVYKSPALNGYKIQWIKEWNEKYPSFPLSTQKLSDWS